MVEQFKEAADSTNLRRIADALESMVSGGTAAAPDNVVSLDWWRQRKVEFKAGVPHDTLRREARTALGLAGDLYARNNPGLVPSARLVCTSTTETKHSVQRSAHYRGDAFDIRTGRGAFRIPESLAGFVAALKTELGPDFVVVLESNHIHVHWSPVYDASRDPSAGTAIA